PYWAEFKKVQRALVRTLTTRPVGSINIAIDALSGTQQVTLVDSLFLSNPQLQSYRVEPDLAVALPEAMMISMKRHQQQPVAQVAFTKRSEEHTSEPSHV